MAKPTDSDRRMTMDWQTTAGHKAVLKKSLSTAGHASNLNPSQAGGRPAGSSSSGKSGGKTSK